MQSLVVDDDDVSLTVARETLRQLGHRCRESSRGEAAWELAQAGQVDVVISDWKMPGLSGLELCERIRASHDLPYVYFMLLTALGEQHDVVTALRAGADDHLVKPLDREHLQARLIVAECVTELHREVERRRVVDQRAVTELRQDRQRLQAHNQRLGRLAHTDPGGCSSSWQPNSYV